MIATCPHCHEPLPKVRRKRIKQALPGPSRKVKRKTTYEVKREHWERVKAAVLKRDGGRCVICGDQADDVHHLLYGSGVRVPFESVDTCASVCRDHHDTAHRGSIWTLNALREWAKSNGYTLAHSAIVRRQAKIENRRPSPPRDGRQDTKGER